LGYQCNRFSTIPEHQWQTSGVWAIKPGFNLLGKFDYDMSQKRVAYSLAGIEIENCCTALRFAWARSKVALEDITNKQYNNKFLAQIVFKGFTDVGTLENNYLSGKISGYKPLDKFQ
jgi:LPS-assembly protein